MGCALYETLGLCCWHGPRCADCPSAPEPDEDLDRDADYSTPVDPFSRNEAP